MASLKNIRHSKYEQHPFHLLDPSPWPLCLSISLFGFVFGGVLWLNGYSFCSNKASIAYMSLWCLFTACLFLYWWFSDIITESVFQGHHTFRVMRGLKIGIALFIASEVMFFFSFFWAFFTYSLSPSIWIGGTWPPKGVQPVDAFGFPLINTWILLTSGCFITYTHASLILGNLQKVRGGLVITLCFALMFLLFQSLEYFSANLFINDSVYGSIFYMITGFHGFHVFIGTIMIFVSYIRSLGPIVTLYQEAHVGFLCAVWYWHFVDVVWLFVWIFVYCWGQAA